jgi:glycine/D-amino acid oxidase-like deaminating enzyme
MKAIIVGGGVMGLCTAWALCRAGHRPVLYEQGPFPTRSPRPATSTA